MPSIEFMAPSCPSNPSYNLCVGRRPQLIFPPGFNTKRIRLVTPTRFLCVQGKDQDNPAAEQSNNPSKRVLMLDSKNLLASIQGIQINQPSPSSSGDGLVHNNTDDSTKEMMEMKEIKKEPEVYQTGSMDTVCVEVIVQNEASAATPPKTTNSGPSPPKIKSEPVEEDVQNASEDVQDAARTLLSLAASYNRCSLPAGASPINGHSSSKPEPNSSKPTTPGDESRSIELNLECQDEELSTEQLQALSTTPQQPAAKPPPPSSLVLCSPLSLFLPNNYVLQSVSNSTSLKVTGSRPILPADASRAQPLQPATPRPPKQPRKTNPALPHRTVISEFIDTVKVDPKEGPNSMAVVEPEEQCKYASTLYVKQPLIFHDFLQKHLNQETYGDRLEWVDKDRIFRVKMHHKNRSDWNPHDFQVFLDWDKAKGRLITHENSQEFYTTSKQRFRTTLNKIREVTEISSNRERGYRYYRINHKEVSLIKRKRKTRKIGVSMLPESVFEEAMANIKQEPLDLN